ncbi:porin [Shewanella avicenniae]|uniref:Porin n=1 Tax=Shewanella avicenniae TaxID=2814294 RepID=A0ABX7QMT1_9GAMM|nr:porin [Shewanella avicenniae]QSX32569.1 porin [Shewanella avicenniae]
MKAYKFAIGLIALSCTSAYAADGFYGEANVMASWKTGLDQQTGIATGYAGYKDGLKIKDIGVDYQLEGYYAASGDRFVNTTESDEFSIRVASLVFKTDLGALYVGKGYSGAYMNLYKRVDIHPFTNTEQYSMNRMLFKQGKYSDNIIAYISPWYNSSLGDFQAKVALVNPHCRDHANDDVLVGRLLYKNGKFNAAINLNRIDENFSGNPNNHTYNRYSVGVDYSFDHITIAYTGEFSKSAFYGVTTEGYDEQVHTVAVTTTVDDFKYGVSYQLRNSDYEINDDIGLAIGSITYAYDKSLDFMIEYATYTGSNEYLDYAEDHSFTVGARFKF